MTVKEALKSELGVYVKDVDYLLLKRGLNGADTCTEDTWKSAPFQIAFADGLFQIYRSPESVSQGDWSRSWGSKDNLKKIIGNIFYRFAPDENPFRGSTSVIEDISDMW
jgi:hypothetical protein